MTEDTTALIKSAAGNIVTIAGYISTAATFLPIMGVVRPYIRTFGVVLIIVGIFRGAQSVIRSKNAQLGALRESTGKELTGLRDEIERLKTRPYDAEHRRLAENKVRNLPDTEKDLLRFLLHHGRTEQEKLRQRCQDHPDIFGRALGATEREGLIQRSEQQKVGRAGTDMYWQINAEWETVLQDLLPAKQATTHFVL